ncbi:MAG TPA: hypothetical protein VGQ06_08155 [Gemmatimonadales bacterium]|jgi:hypothetical protein|nr:hypothetical protein [Gemmatimonadales bacterium]
MYIHHAENLARGTPYAETGYIYNAHNPTVGPRTYPPAFPLLLAPLVRVFGRALWPMKALVVASLAASLVLLLRLFRGVLPSPHLELLVLLTGLNPVLWDFKDRVVADLPFLCFVLLSFASFARAAAPAQTPRRLMVSALLAGFFAYAAYATRVLGIVLVPTFLAHDLIRRRRVGVAAVAAGAVFVILAGAQYLVWLGDRSYLDQLTVTPASLGRNALGYARSLSDLWANGYSERARKALFLIVGGLAALGYANAVRVGRNEAGWPEVFPWPYLAVVLVWPSFQGVRFLLPVVPFYLLYCLRGTRVLDDAVQRRWGRNHLVLAGLSAAAALSYAGQYSTMPFGRFPSGVGRPESVAFFEFVKTATDSNAVFVFSKPRALALFTGRRAAAPFSPSDPCRLWGYLAEIGASYVVTGPALSADEVDAAAEYLRRFVDQYPTDLRSVWRAQDIAVYRIERNPCAPTAAGSSRRGWQAGGGASAAAR